MIWGISQYIFCKGGKNIEEVCTSIIDYFFTSIFSGLWC
jgi:hypothetical protein